MTLDERALLRIGCHFHVWGWGRGRGRGGDDEPQSINDRNACDSLHEIHMSEILLECLICFVLFKGKKIEKKKLE
jgi:hypothetical protein